MRLLPGMRPWRCPIESLQENALSVSTNRAPTQGSDLQRTAHWHSCIGDSAQRLRMRLGNELQIVDGSCLFLSLNTSQNAPRLRMITASDRRGVLLW